MFAALFRAVADLSAPPLRRVVALSLGLAVLCFVALWLGIAVALNAGVHFAWRPIDWLVQLVAAAGVAGLSWLLFPAVVTLIMGFFLDRVAAAVETLDDPGGAPPRRPPTMEVIGLTLKLMIVTIVANLLVLPIYVLAPVVNFFVFLCLNGYLLGREYFEVVALRRLDTATIKAVRHRFGWRIFAGGVMIAGLFAIPFVNLLAPVIATAFMVRLYARLARRDPQAFVA